MPLQRWWVSLVGMAMLAGCATTGSDDSAALQDHINGIVEEWAGNPELSTPPGEPLIDAGSNMSFQVMSFDALDGWTGDDHGAALKAFQLSCDRIRKLDSTTILGGLASRIEDWRPSCDAADTVRPDAARAFFELAFQPVRMAPEKEALITAYYEPELAARRHPDGEFKYPLYRKPNEVTFRNGAYGVKKGGGFGPYLTRGEIDRGALDGRGLEIAYLNDPVDTFFLHVQGSGKLRFADGSVARVAFAAKNGHKYSSVGRAMMKEGVITGAQASADGIKRFVRNNPEQGQRFLAHNRSYIFFREVKMRDPSGGPEGALGVQLVDGRSIAVDRRYTPLGAPVWLESNDGPAGAIHRLVVAQDTGSAIKGPQRADLFWGSGEAAGSTAGRMKHPGQLVVLLPTATVKRLVDNGS